MGDTKSRSIALKGLALALLRGEDPGGRLFRARPTTTEGARTMQRARLYVGHAVLAYMEGEDGKAHRFLRAAVGEAIWYVALASDAEPGEHLGDLEGPACWYVDVGGGRVMEVSRAGMLAGALEENISSWFEHLSDGTLNKVDSLGCL